MKWMNPDYSEEFWNQECVPMNASMDYGVYLEGTYESILKVIEDLKATYTGFYLDVEGYYDERYLYVYHYTVKTPLETAQYRVDSTKKRYSTLKGMRTRLMKKSPMMPSDKVKIMQIEEEMKEIMDLTTLLNTEWIKQQTADILENDLKN